MQQKFFKKSLVSKIISSELAAVSSHYYPENTFHQESMYEKTVLRFGILLKKNFSNWNLPNVMNKDYPTTVVIILAVLGTLWHVDCPRVYWSVTL